MIKKRIVLNGLALFDRQGLAENFSRMAAKGWMIEKMVGIPFHIYRRTEPKNIKFSVVYINNTANSAPLTAEQQDFVDYCRELGWQWVTSFERMHVFATENPDTPDIETDPVVQVENIFASLKRELAGYIILTAMNMFSIYNNISMYFENPQIYVQGHRYTVLFVNIPVTIMILLMAMDYVIWYIKAKQAAREENILYSSPFHKIVVFVQCAVLTDLIIWLIVTGGPELLAVIFGVIAAAVGTMELLNTWLKESGGRANENYWIVSAGVALVVFLLTFVAIGIILVSG